MQDAGGAERRVASQGEATEQTRWGPRTQPGGGNRTSQVGATGHTGGNLDEEELMILVSGNKEPVPLPCAIQEPGSGQAQASEKHK